MSKSFISDSFEVWANCWWKIRLKYESVVRERFIDEMSQSFANDLFKIWVSRSWMVDSSELIADEQFSESKDCRSWMIYSKWFAISKYSFANDERFVQRERFIQVENWFKVICNTKYLFVCETICSKNMNQSFANDLFKIKIKIIHNA